MSKVVFLKIRNVSKEDVFETVKKSMRLGEWKKYIPGTKIFIKVNGIADQMIPGVSTSPWVLEAVLQEVTETYPNAEISVGDADLAAYKQLNRAFKLWGYDELAAKYGARLVNLSDEPSRKIKINGKILKELDVPDVLLEADSILNLPVMKTHIMTTITCCLKNHWGLIPRGVRHNFHPLVDQVIADENSFFKTKFNVIDGTVAMEGNAPKTGVPKICNVIMASADRVAADYTVARYMGFDPEKIAHLKNSEAMGIGTTKDIEIVGDKFEVNPFVEGIASQNAVLKWERRMRKIPGLRIILFRTPVFAIPAYLAKHYNATWWYRKEGIHVVKKFLETDYGRLLYKPIVKKFGIKDFGKLD